MISRKRARHITSTSFPNGPEELAKHLGVKAYASPLVGVEGWCVRGVNTVVRVNSSSSSSRQRFTLAHELAHLVLGTEPDIASEPFRSTRQEELDADQLASEFLIPDAQLQTYLHGHLPVDAKMLTRLAKAAKISPVVAACRVVSAAGELGLENAAVVFFVDECEQWRYSHGLRFGRKDAGYLFQAAMNSKPRLAREDNHDGNVVVGSIIDAQVYQVLFMQLLSAEDATQETYDEEMRRLADKLFGNDRSFQQSVAASLGIVKTKCAGQSLDDAFQYFIQNYVGVKYSDEKGRKLGSELGKRYLRLYLQRWFG